MGERQREQERERGARARGAGKDGISRSGFLLQNQTYPEVYDCSWLHTMLPPPA